MEALKKEVEFRSHTERNEKNLKKELKELLQKYGASIGFDLDDCSDTHGMSGEVMELSMGDKVIVTVDGWSFEADDI